MPVMMRTIGVDNENQAILPIMKSGVYMPLITGERLIGVLALESNQAQTFDNNALSPMNRLGMLCREDPW